MPAPLTNKELTDALQALQDQLDGITQRLGEEFPGKATMREAIEFNHVDAKNTDDRLRRYENRGLKSVLTGFGNWLFAKGQTALTQHGIEFLYGGNGQTDPGISWHDGSPLRNNETINSPDAYVNITGIIEDSPELFIHVLDTRTTNLHEANFQMTNSSVGYSSIEESVFAGNSEADLLIFAAEDTVFTNSQFGAYASLERGGLAFANPIEETLSASQNDYAPSGAFAGQTWYSSIGLRLDMAADRNITGLGYPGYPTTTGTNTLTPLHLIWNVGTGNLTLKPNSGSSSAANQIVLPGDLTLLPGHAAWVFYDQTSDKWRVVHSSDILHDAAWDAKGDSVWGISADTAQKISVGSDGYFINALASETVGVKWNPFTLLNDISATISANTDDWAPTGISTASVIRATTTASWNLTGITTGADGRVLLLLNVGSNNLVLKDDVTSTAANRFQLNGDVTLAADEACVLWYDATSSRWRMAGHYATAASTGYTTVQDEGVGLTQRSTLNFVGAGVTAADSGGVTTVTISGSAATGYATIQDEGSGLTQRTTMNFTGAGVTAADSGGITVVTIPGGAGTTVATDTIFDAKGDLPVGTGADTSARLAVGANGLSPIAASGETTGIKWGTPFQTITDYLQNEIKAWPPLLPNDTDLVTMNHWWDDVATPTTHATLVDVAGEASLDELWEWALKCVTDANNEGIKQRYTYADEQRIKSGKTISALVWVATTSGGSGITATFVNSDATSTAGASIGTNGDWTLLAITGHVCAGTYVELQVTKDTSGTFYLYPLTVMIGSQPVPLRPRQLVFQRGSTPPTQVVATAGKATASAFTTVSCNSATHNLAAMMLVDLNCLDTTSTDGWDIFLRITGTSESALADQNAYASIANQSGTRRVHNTFPFVLDDSQQIDYEANRWTGSGTMEQFNLNCAGFWIWE